MNFAKFLRTPFLTEHLWWLLLCLNITSSLQVRLLIFLNKLIIIIIIITTTTTTATIIIIMINNTMPLLSLNKLSKKLRATIIFGNFVNKP